MVMSGPADGGFMQMRRRGRRTARDVLTRRRCPDLIGSAYQHNLDGLWTLLYMQKTSKKKTKKKRAVNILLDIRSSQNSLSMYFLGYQINQYPHNYLYVLIIVIHLYWTKPTNTITIIILIIHK